MIPGISCRNCDFYNMMRNECRLGTPIPIPQVSPDGEVKIAGGWPPPSEGPISYCGQHSEYKRLKAKLDKEQELLERQ